MATNQWPWLNGRNGHRGDGTVTDAMRLAVVNDSISSIAFSRQALLDSMADPRRSLDDECGYPNSDTDISTQLYRQLYDREAVATRVVQVMPRESWQMSPLVYDDEDPDKTTKFEEAWDALGKTLSSGSMGSRSWHGQEQGSPVWEYLRRADELSGIGHFGIVLLGIDDGRNLQDPVDGVVTLNTAGCGDSTMTEAEERAMREPPVRRVWNGRYERVAIDANPTVKRLQPVLEDQQAPKLTGNEAQVVTNWVQGRERVKEARRLAQQLEQRALNQRRGLPPEESPVEPPRLLTANECKQISVFVQGKVAGRFTLNSGRWVDNARVAPDPRKMSEGRKPTKKGSAKAISGGSPTSVPFSQENVGGQSESQQARSPADVLGYSQAFGMGGGNSPTASNPGNTYPPTGTQAAGGQYGQKQGSAGKAAQGGAGGFKLGGPPDGQGYGGSYGYPPSGGDGAPQSSDYSYGGPGQGATAPGSSLAGTDQQYFGVQYGPSESFGPQPTRQHRLLFLRCFDESLVQVVRYEWNVRNPRFGLPVMYRVTLNDPREQHSGIGLPLATVFVHWSRVIHVADNLQSSEIFGVPRMRPVLNAILDDRKITGSSAEGYFRAGCSPVYSIETHPTLGGDVEVDKQGLLDQVEQVTNGLQRWLLTSGLSIKTLPPAVIDPKSYHDIQIEKVCIQLAMPVRVFKGSERGELASSQDDETWNERVTARRHFYITPRIVVPFIDRLIQVGVLPEPDSDDGYTVYWPDPESLNDKDKAAICLSNTQALSAFIAGNGESAMTLKDFFSNPKFLNMDDDEAESIIDATKEAHEDQDTMTNPAMVEGHPVEAPEGSQAAADTQQAADQFDAKNEAMKEVAQTKVAAQGPPGADKSGDGEAGAKGPPAANEAFVVNGRLYLPGRDYVVNDKLGVDEQWVTLKGGAHILIGAGKSVGQAIKEHFAGREAERQAKKAKEPPTHGGGHDAHGAGHGHGHELEHAAHEYHTAHEAHEVAEVAGVGHKAHDVDEALHEAHAAEVAHGAVHTAAGHAPEGAHDAAHGADTAHHVAEAFGGSQEAHEATAAAHEAGHETLLAVHGGSLHEGGEHLDHPTGLDAGAIVARHAYGPMLKAAAHLVGKMPGGEKTANFIADAHDGLTKAAGAAVKRMADRYGHATAAAILGAGSLTSKNTMRALGIPGHVASAVPGHQFIGAIPLLGLAEAGKRMGLVGPDSNLEKGLGHVGGAVHTIRETIGRPFKAAGDLYQRGMRAAGRAVGKAARAVGIKTNMGLTVNDDVVDPNVDIEKAAEELWNEYAKEARDVLEKTMKKHGIGKQDDPSPPTTNFAPTDFYADMRRIIDRRRG